MSALQRAFGFASDRQVSSAELEAARARLLEQIEAIQRRMAASGARPDAIAEATEVERRLLARLGSLKAED